jgi:hypothetical protein
MPSVLRFHVFVTCQYSDYIGADNAGLHALLLRREGPDKEGELKDTGLDFRTIKRLKVVEDLYSVLAWVEKTNKTRKEYPSE